MPNAYLRNQMRSGFSCAALAVGVAVASGYARPTRAAVEDLPLMGSTLTGSPFFRGCPDNHVLTGFRYRSGLVLDGVSIKCRPVRSDGTLGTEVLVGTQAGGNGGTLANKSCSSNQVIVSQRAAGGVAVLSFFCVRWSATSRAGFGSGDVLAITGQPFSAAAHACSSSTQPATGIRGRHGMIIDAIGLVCGTP